MGSTEGGRGVKALPSKDTRSHFSFQLVLFIRVDIPFVVRLEEMRRERSVSYHRGEEGVGRELVSVSRVLGGNL